MTREQFKAHLYNVNVKDSRIHEEALLREHAEQRAEIEDLKKIADLKEQRCQVKEATIDTLQTEIERLKAERDQQGRYAVEMFDALKQAQAQLAAAKGALEFYADVTNYNCTMLLEMGTRARQALGKEHP